MSVSIVNHNVLRRHLTSAQKLAIVQASHQPGILVAEVARR
jgi:transposase-like protein